jgi:hypothetical protein
LAHAYLSEALDKGYKQAYVLLADLALKENDNVEAHDLMQQFVLSQQRATNKINQEE